MTKHVKPFIDYPEAAKDTKAINGCLRFVSIFIGSVCVGAVLAYLAYVLYQLAVMP